MSSTIIEITSHTLLEQNPRDQKIAGVLSRLPHALLALALGNCAHLLPPAWPLRHPATLPRLHEADQIARYREAYEAAGHPGTGRTAVTRSAFVIQDGEDELYFGRDRNTRESAGMLDGGAARSGPAYAGSAEEVAEKLAADEAVQAADWVLFANPNQLGAAYNAKIFAGWAQVWRLLGWDR